MKNIIKLFIYLSLLLTFIFIQSVHAETIIYDNLTTSTYKIIKIDDDMNLKYLTDYKYEVYVNGLFLGYYQKNELIFIPDNSNITIYVPAPIKTDFTSYFSIFKSYFIIGLSFIVCFGILILLLFWIYKKVK